MPELLNRLQVALADRYRIEAEIGEGGMATVYLAHDLRHDRKVALKVLHPELAAVLGAERFLAEIKITANLQHPNILPLFDSGAADGFLFYVMPYVEGESLRGRLNREKQLPMADAVRIATGVAAALDYAHRHGVVHRDIKPENILLQDGRALVADFGIALAASKAGGNRMTQTGLSLGTPHYMSPEQATGEREITARSDVYAFGVVVYEMLAGEPPFSGSTARPSWPSADRDAPPILPERQPSRPTSRRRCSPRSRSSRPTGSARRRSSPRRWRAGEPQRRTGRWPPLRCPAPRPAKDAARCGEARAARRRGGRGGGRGMGMVPSRRRAAGEPVQPLHSAGAGAGPREPLRQPDRDFARWQAHRLYRPRAPGRPALGPGARPAHLHTHTRHRERRYAVLLA